MLSTKRFTSSSILPVLQKRLYSSRPMEAGSGAVQRKPIYLKHPLCVCVTGIIGRAKVSIKTIQNMYKRKEPISMMTAQDYPSGLMVDQSGIDMCLVGDSLAMVALGYDSTNPLTVEVKDETHFIKLGNNRY
jgi:3-methyl-2-oxobutanoate hydroxymethyltransferase